MRLTPDPLYARTWLPLIRFGVGLLYRGFGGYRIQGVENLPRSGRVLVACNHLSLADPLAMLVASPRPLFYMAAEELHQMAWVGPTIRFLQSFPVRRGEWDQNAIAHARALLRNEQGLVVYPEGRISPDGELLPLYPGVAMLALRERCPVVPARMRGTDGFLPLGSKLIRFHPKSVRFGPALDFGAPRPGESIKTQVQAATERLREAMLGL
ncbi:1-acyl-sn-glycerol-3-phosphate acyltransferase [bacterium CPR1]|nr:1-acyl-sn-glycerol-3-phosphate acyltransferase [bacterium CPR1]